MLNVTETLQGSEDTFLSDFNQHLFLLEARMSHDKRCSGQLTRVKKTIFLVFRI